MSNNSLFERLDGLNDGSVKQSIERNLNNIFMTRQGSTLIRVDDFGVPDFNGYGSREKAIPEIEKIIVKNIREFEPRLKNVRVRHKQDDSTSLRLNFSIEAYLGRDNTQITIVMTETGKIRVQG